MTSHLRSSPSYREICKDFSAEFGKLSGSRRQAEAQANLFGNPSPLQAGRKDFDRQEEEVLLRERGSLENAHMLIDEALDGAQTNTEALSRQTQAFRDIRSSLQGLGARFPNVGRGLGGIL